MPELRLACCADRRRGVDRRPAPAQKPIRSKSRLLKPKDILQMIILVPDSTGGIPPHALFAMISRREADAV
jgi:hypothetical protein